MHIFENTSVLVSLQRQYFYIWLSWSIENPGNCPKINCVSTTRMYDEFARLLNDLGWFRKIFTFSNWQRCSLNFSVVYVLSLILHFNDSYIQKFNLIHMCFLMSTYCSFLLFSNLSVNLLIPLFFENLPIV